MIGLAEMEARLVRLERLARGLCVELSLWKVADTPLLAAEKQAYRSGIKGAIAGLDAARVALGVAVKRERAEQAPSSRG